MSEFTPITTQEEFDRAIGERVKRERETVSKKFENYISPEDLSQRTSDLESKVTSLTEELATAKAQLTEKETEISGYKLEKLKAKVAREAGLEWGADEFLKGTDEESLKKSATALKGLIGKRAPLASTEGGTATDKDAELKSLLQRLKKGE